MKLSKKEIENKFPPIINGTYKKDTPSKDIGYQKWEVIKTYEVEARYEIVAKTKKEAEELLERRETPNEEVDDYGDTFRETIQSKFTNDLSGDEPTTWKKIEECIPSDDTDSDNDFAHFINYDEPTWSTDDYEWLKKEDGTDIKNDNHS